MRFKRRQKAGFTLPEVIIAVMILSLTSVASVNLIVFMMKFSLMNNNSMIATNLAREGVEIVRNQRDTNWLKWGGSLRESWNNGFDGVTNIDGMPYGDTVSSFTQPSLDGDEQYFYFLLHRKEKPMGPGANPPKYPYVLELWKVNETLDDPIEINDLLVSTDTDIEARLYYENGVGYVHDNTQEDTPFVRIVEVSYYDNDFYASDPPLMTSLQVPDNTAGINDANTIRVRSIVGYKYNSRWKYVVLETYLTDWYFRDSQTDDT